MIPDFEKDGFLPPGIHIATLEEVRKRFSTNIVRNRLYSSLIDFIEDISKIGCGAIFVDGSFTTNKRQPNDLDICWDDRTIDYNIACALMPALLDRSKQKLLYNADIFPAFVSESVAKIYFIDFFQLDKTTGEPKGIIQINL